MASQIDLPKATSLGSTTWSETFSEVLHGLEDTAGQYCHLIDQFESLCAAYESSQDSDDVARHLRNVRKAYATASSIWGSVYTSMKKASMKTEDFSQVLERLEVQISRTALSYGLKLLPDELLFEVLFCAADTPEEAAALSYVCKRFRTTIMTSRKFWRRYCLSSLWSPKQILATAERSGFKSLAARISLGIRSLNPSSKAILSLHQYLEELHIYHLNLDNADEVRNILKGSAMPALHTLVVFRSEHQMPFDDSLHFYETCEIPLLQNLVVNFVPRFSLARDLVRCTLHLHGRIRLQAYLDFLSSAKKLREVILWNNNASVASDESLQLVTLPSLDTFSITYNWSLMPINHLLVKVLLPSAVNRLIMRGSFMSQDLSCLLRFLRVIPSVRELAIELWSTTHEKIFLDRVIGALPPRLESLSIAAQQKLILGNFDHVSGEFIARNLACIRFSSGLEVPRKFVQDLCSYFQDVGHTTVELNFQTCRGVRDGTHKLDTVESALTDT